MKPVRLLVLAVLALAATGNAGAEQLGRLFFTPEQRAQLELGKQRNGSAADDAPSISVNGIVQKRGGGRTVWINGVPQTTRNADGHAPDSEPVAVPGQSQPVKLKVGQKVPVNPSASGQ
ncbi:MAG TPA: hypothetical protein VFW53_09350 [Gallionella sp.]|nr:hypothetical protein [Gallionella sp.]